LPRGELQGKTLARPGLPCFAPGAAGKGNTQTPKRKTKAAKGHDRCKPHGIIYIMTKTVGGWYWMFVLERAAKHQFAELNHGNHPDRHATE
jgi:hypothetical protein